MIQKDLVAFGVKLRRLRKAAGFYQEELAEKLSLIHAQTQPETDLHLDGNRISKWERAFKGKDGREWRPKRQYMFYLIQAFAEQLTLETAQQWAGQAGYLLDTAELQPIFQAHSETPAAAVAAFPTLTSDLRLLDDLPQTQLFGVEQQRQQLIQMLETDQEPWLITIDGMGGIGKTALAGAIVREIVSAGRFYNMAWVSAKQEKFIPGVGLQPTHGPALDAETLTDNLLAQLDDRVPLTRSPEEKLAILTRLLKQSPCLIIIDNLETVTDYQTLLPLLIKLTKPSKIVLTSRHSLHDHPQVFCLSLKGLSQADAFAFFKHEAGVRGQIDVAESLSKGAMENIYSVVGGNPLALKLVLGQLRVLPLPQVLDSLQQARGKSVDDLYTYIYWQAWHALTLLSQEVLLAMPLVQGGTFAQLSVVSQLETAELNQALTQLTQLSLVEVGGSIEQRRYTIHRLTESFLLTEVIKWQSAS